MGFTFKDIDLLLLNAQQDSGDWAHLWCTISFPDPGFCAILGYRRQGEKGEALSKPKPLSPGARPTWVASPGSPGTAPADPGPACSGRTGPRAAAAEPGALIPPLPVQSHRRGWPSPSSTKKFAGGKKGFF